MARHAGRMQDADLTPAVARQREIDKRVLWLWLATLVVLAIALVFDHVTERDEPLSVAAQSLFLRAGG
jgi:uncharacterized membrane protein